MIFRTGKYKGKSLEYVKQSAPWYIKWVHVHRPEMLVERTPSENKKTIIKYEKPISLTPNFNFDNELPDVMERVKETPNPFWD
jgi:hypothetical protein